MHSLKQKTVRAGTARLGGQIARSLLRLGSIIVLARLLDPADFGLVAMVMVITGILETFATGGLSQATVQQEEVSDRQISAMFWCNIVFGISLALLCIGIAPFIGSLYHEPRTASVLVAIAPAFIFTGAGAQHIALLQRDMRLGTQSVLEVVAEALSALVGIGMALAGFGYWSLVGAALTLPLAITAGAWIATGWIPSLPQRGVNVGSLLRFGGLFTLNSLVVYAAYNFEKLLLGRSFGSIALGLYSRAYELVNLPTRIISSAFANVTFAALCRVQADPARLKSYFLKGYSLVLSLTIPATIFCFVLADDIIMIVLGPKWTEATQIFRLLAPTILVFGIINPFGWLMSAIGLQARSLYLALIIAPLTIASYLIGLPYGPQGVALAYSTAMCLWLVPHVLLCIYRTPIHARDLLPAIGRPLGAGAAAAIVAALVQLMMQSTPFPLVRLITAGLAMSVTYAFILFIVMRQKDFYLDLLRTLRQPIEPATGAAAEQRA